jgi:hypothetical protein
MKSYECLPRKSSTRFSSKESKKSALSRSKSYVSGERGKKPEGSLTAPYSMFAITHPEAEFINI